MTARERRPESGGGRVERGADAVEELLDDVDEQNLADHDRQEERWHPPVRGANRLDDDDDGEHENGYRRAREIGDELEHLRRPGNGVVVGPAADARIQPDEVAARAHEVGERSDGDAADHGDRECEGQREPGRRPRIETAAEKTREPRVPNCLRRELLSRCGCRRRSCPRRRWIATRQEIDGDPGGESEKEKDDEGHG